MLYCMRRSDGLGRTWTWSTAWLASTVYSKVDYTVLVRTAMSQWVLMSSRILEQRQSSRWAGQDGSWVPLGGEFYHVGSCFDTREGSGSGAVGRAEGGVSSSIVTLLSERESQPACQSVNWVALQLLSCQVSRRVGKRREMLNFQSHTKWWCQPSSGRPPTPKQFDGHDVSLRFSITHGFTHPVAAVVAVVATIVMGQGWTGENFSWGARVHEPEVGCWTWGGRFQQRQPVSPPAPLPPAVLLPCGRMCQAGQRRHGVAWRGHGRPSGPLLTLVFLSPFVSRLVGSLGLVELLDFCEPTGNRSLIHTESARHAVSNRRNSSRHLQLKLEQIGFRGAWQGRTRLVVEEVDGKEGTRSSKARRVVHARA